MEVFCGSAFSAGKNVLGASVVGGDGQCCVLEKRFSALNVQSSSILRPREYLHDLSVWLANERVKLDVEVSE